MTRKERLMATMQGKAVDRVPVSFYELNGLDEDPQNQDPFNIYSHPSWLPLIELAREKTDRIVMRTVPFIDKQTNKLDELKKTQTYYDQDGSRHTITEIHAGTRILREHTRRDRDINTVWTLEHLLKDADDLKAWIDLPDIDDIGIPDYSRLIKAEESLGDSGIVMVNIPDSLCIVAALFNMEEYTIIAMTEPELFHAALKKVQKWVFKKAERVAKEFPGRLWRIYGPEYATPPYLPPRLYQEYVVKYDAPIIQKIHQYGGFARIHQHGNLKDVLDHVVATGCMGLDPIEPPPQGDVALSYVRQKYGEQLVLFGNLEVSDIETLDSNDFGKKVVTAIEEGTAGSGRGFVLMPSACPYGRILSPLALKNYYKMIEVVERY